MAISFLRRDLASRGLKLLPPALLFLSACTTGGVASQTMTNPTPASVTVQLMNADGRNVATANLTEGLAPEVASDARVASAARRSPSPASGVTVAVSVTDLPPGTHGFHVHAVGRCDRPDFAGVGPHLNPDNRTHGVMSQNGPHAGDLPNLTVDKDRTAIAAFFVGHLTMSQIESSSSGASVVIDANPDDNTTDPDGRSGKHIACGVIRPGTAHSASPAASPTATAAGTRNVIFTGLHEGAYPAHLHSVCSGSQNFHIAVLGQLTVDAQGSGAIAVPAGDFGHGWCVIVYADASLRTVAAMQTI